MAEPFLFAQTEVNAILPEYFGGLSRPLIFRIYSDTQCILYEEQMNSTVGFMLFVTEKPHFVFLTV